MIIDHLYFIIIVGKFLGKTRELRNLLFRQAPFRNTLFRNWNFCTVNWTFYFWSIRITREGRIDISHPSSPPPSHFVFLIRCFDWLTCRASHLSWQAPASQVADDYAGSPPAQDRERNKIPRTPRIAPPKPSHLSYPRAAKLHSSVSRSCIDSSN